MDINFLEKKIQHRFCYPSIPMQKCYFHTPGFRLLSEAIEFLQIVLGSFIHFSSIHLIFIDHWLHSTFGKKNQSTPEEENHGEINRHCSGKLWWMQRLMFNREKTHKQTTLSSVGKALKKQHCLGWVLHDMFMVVKQMEKKGKGSQHRKYPV